MNMCSIASGSNGNCIYVGDKETHLLVDVGISKKKICEGINSIGVDPENISAILITHEHIDHIKGLGIMARAYGKPIYGTKETLMAAFNTKSLGKMDESLFNFIEPDKEFCIGELTIKPFSTSHDAVNPVCYTIKNDDSKVGVATDLGKYDDYIIENLKDVNSLLIEANHDENMLQVGPYPYYLKQRILGDTGHLSNSTSGKLLCNLINKDLKYIFLGHLSQNNNYPELAYETVKIEIEDVTKENDVKLMIAKRNMPSELITV